MWRFDSSLRRKIILGYYLIGAFVIGLAMLAYLEMGVIKQSLFSIQRTEALFETLLETRRFEKNYLLYSEPKDFDTNAEYLSKARQIIQNNADLLYSLPNGANVTHLENHLAEYGLLMRQLRYAADKDKSPGAELESKIRKSGSDIVTLAEQFAMNERAALSESMSRVQKMLAVFVGGLAVLVIIAGQGLSRMICAPLKMIEKSMEAVATGDHSTIDIQSPDREIKSLVSACNHVFHELESRQMKLLTRSARLAAIGTLVSEVAHELNNPISNISTTCQILQEEHGVASPEFMERMLTRIDDQAMRARNIVRSLLDFARERNSEKEYTQLKPVMEETVNFLREHFPPEVTVKVDVPPDLFITADRQRMQQAFLNIIKNAAEALEGMGDISITARRGTFSISDDELSENSGAVFKGLQIEISDNGVGISPEIAPKIFDPFFTTKGEGKGSGLGLFIVREIVMEHGGFVSVKSKVGEGTCFYIRFPSNITTINA